MSWDKNNGVIGTPFMAPQAIDLEAADDVDYLLDMRSREFEAFVLAHLGPDTPARIWRALLDDDVVIRTKNTLARVLHKADLELVALQPASGDPADMAAYETRRQEIVDFRTVANNRQYTIKQAAHERADRARTQSVKPGFARQMRQLIRDLAQGINAHRLACIDAGIEPEAHDEALWGLLDELSPPPLFDGAQSFTLSELVINGKWAAGRPS